MSIGDHQIQTVPSQYKAPRAFVSHGSEDKLTYAEPLARELRKLGVDAWLDKWELRHGDDLVQKVFDEGLGGAATVLFVMTPTSILKPWVRTELSNAVARHIEGKLRVIPILAKECDVPQSVVSLLWLVWEDEGGASGVAAKVAATIFGQSDKPPLGTPPRFLKESTFELPGLSKVDAVVLDMLYRSSLKLGNIAFMQLADVAEEAHAAGISTDVLLESAEMLASKNYIFAGEYGVEIFSFSPNCFLSIANWHGVEVAAITRRLVAAVLNENLSSVSFIAEHVGAPRAVCLAIAADLENRGLISQSITIDGDSSLYNSTSALKRWLASQT